MKTAHRFFIALLVPAIFLVAFCLAPEAARAEPMGVMVSILPQKFFVQEVGGDLVDVSVMVSPGASPATYEPKPAQMALLAKTKAFFTVGVPFEAAWLERIQSANPDMLMVHTEKDVPKVPMGAKAPGEGHGEEHGEKHEGEHGHKHGMLDPHIWLAPELVKIQARNIRDGLSKADPANAAGYATRCAAFEKKIEALDTRIKEILGDTRGKGFMVYHPAFGYFAREYGLEQIPVEMEGKDPSPRELANFITLARDKGVQVIFVQPQFSEKSAQTIASAVGAEVRPLNPLAYDWDANLLGMTRAIRPALR